MAFGTVRSLIVSGAASLLRSSGAQRRASFSTHVASSPGGKRAPIICVACLGNQWVLQERFYAVQRAKSSAGKVGFSRGRARSRVTAPRSVSTAVKEEDEEVEEEEDEEGEKSRNQSKRDAKRARQWGVDLARLAPPQLKKVITWAGLEEDVYGAVMIVKNLKANSKARNGRRRQINYIGGLLRDVDPSLIEPVLQAAKDGDVGSLIINSPVLPADEESGPEEEDEDSPQLVAEGWLHGLINGIPSSEEEVYSMYDVDYDRQELRKLVISAQKYTAAESIAATSEEAQEDGADPSPMLLAQKFKSEENLRQFLIRIARQRLNQTFSYEY